MQCLGCLPVARTDTVPELLGITEHGVRRLLADGVIVRLRRGVLVGACLLERAEADARLAHQIALRALLLTYEDGVASHESAAVLWQLPLLRLPDFPVATRPRGAWRGGISQRVRIAPVPQGHLRLVAGLMTTSMPRTVVDLARALPFRDAVVAGDAALRGDCTHADLAEMLSECAAWADLGRARRAVANLDARSESVLESVSRAIFHERQLPTPILQHEIPLDGEIYRVDFYWPHNRTIGEADGRAKYSLDSSLTPEQVAWREKLREDALRDAGYRFVRWTYGQMLGQTDATIDRIQRRLTD